MGYRLDNIFPSVVSTNSAVQSGANLKVCQSGTSTKVSLFSDRACLVSRANPVEADSSGRFPVFYTTYADLLTFALFLPGLDPDVDVASASYNQIEPYAGAFTPFDPDDFTDNTIALDKLEQITGPVLLGAISTSAGNVIAVPYRVPIIIPVSDETTGLSTGTAKVTFRMPYAFKLTSVRSSLTTVSSSGLTTVDINVSGSTILSTKLTIDQGEKTSTTAATPAVLTTPAGVDIADDAEVTIDIDVVHSSAAGLKVTLIGYPTALV